MFHVYFVTVLAPLAARFLRCCAAVTDVYPLSLYVHAAYSALVTKLRAALSRGIFAPDDHASHVRLAGRRHYGICTNSAAHAHCRAASFCRLFTHVLSSVMQRELR